MAVTKAPEDRCTAEPFVPRHGGLTALREAAARCRGCPPHRDATRTVFGTGPADARLMLVGEQPGDQEDRQGEPFVGPAGKLLDRAPAEAGIDPGEAYVTNAVKHFTFTQAEPRKRRIRKAPPCARQPPAGPGRPRRMVPTVHASAVLRADDREDAHRGFVQDLKTAAHLLPQTVS